MNGRCWRMVKGRKSHGQRARLGPRSEVAASGRRRRGGRRAEAALEVVAEGLPRPVVVLAVLLEVRLDVLRRELGRGRPRRRAAREEALDDLGRALAQAELEDGAGDGALGAAPRLLARGGRRRRRFRVVQVRVYVSQCLHGQAVVPGVGHYHSSRSLVPFPCACTAPGLRLVTSAGERRCVLLPINHAVDAFARRRTADKWLSR